MLGNVIGVAEASKITGLSEGTIKNYCAAGKFEAKKIGKTWILDKVKLEGIYFGGIFKDEKNKSL